MANEIVAANRMQKKEILKRLKELQVGTVVRFQGTSYEQAITSEECQFYMIYAIQPAPAAGRVRLVSLDGKLAIERDDSHLVHAHNVMFQIEPCASE